MLKFLKKPYILFPLILLICFYNVLGYEICEEFCSATLLVIILWLFINFIISIVCINKTIILNEINMILSLSAMIISLALFTNLTESLVFGISIGIFIHLSVEFIDYIWK